MIILLIASTYNKEYYNLDNPNEQEQKIPNRDQRLGIRNSENIIN
jgi:hypothetical protein